MTDRDARDLYQELFLDHGSSPRNEGPLASATHEATLKNPLCGDRVTVRVAVQAGVVVAAKFEARGCMLARASASLLTEAIDGRSVEDALDLARSVESMVAGEPGVDSGGAGAIEALRGVRDFPARRGCVTLAWRALSDALASAPRPAGG